MQLNFNTKKDRNCEFTGCRSHSSTWMPQNEGDFSYVYTMQEKLKKKLQRFPAYIRGDQLIFFLNKSVVSFRSAISEHPIKKFQCAAMGSKERIKVSSQLKKEKRKKSRQQPNGPIHCSTHLLLSEYSLISGRPDEQRKTDNFIIISLLFDYFTTPRLFLQVYISLRNQTFFSNI